jgi:signal peptidase I
VIDDEHSPPRESSTEDDSGDTGSPKSRSSFWRELPVLVAVAVVVALLVRSFVLQSFWIPSGSMENTLQRGDRVLVNKLVYDFRDPRRGEVVVFVSPMDWRSDPADEDFIKRVIATGGDTVSYDSDKERISVNGQPLNEDSYLYTDPATARQDLPSRDDYEFSVSVPAGRLWVMGDHRAASGDSREHYLRTGGDIEDATISVDALVGKAFVQMWPMDRLEWLTVPATFGAVPDPAAGAVTSP